MDYLDLPELQRRGLLKKIKEKEPLLSPSSKSESEYVNLAHSQTPELNSQSQSSPFDLLDSLTRTSGSTPQEQSIPSPDFQDLKVKLEDFGYKLDRLADKLAIIESRVEEFEKRVVPS